MFKKKYQHKPRRERTDETGEPQPLAPVDPEKARPRTMNRAVKLLAAKPRSVAELRERLLEKPWTNAEVVDAVLEKLKEYGYLNDQQYAESFANFKLRQKPLGRRRLQQTLQQKKLDKETVEATLTTVFEETPEADLIDRALEKRIRARGIPKDRDETKKLFDYLLRQGFGFELVRDKIRGISIEDVNDDV